ncbi:MAG: alpha/beta hydrolase [Deltaproteobacteria bacterium]|nr:alpha/beta hydrolase [Deltaproteobacteria bacterium]
MSSIGRTIRRVLFMPLNWIWIGIVMAGLAGVLICFYPRVENFFVFFPDRELTYSPSDYDLSYEAVHFAARDGTRLHGWFFPAQGQGPVILFSHGNAGNISHRLENVQGLVAQGLGVFLYDYRGYGKSKGRPSESGIYQDGLAACDFLTKQKRIEPDRIVCFGRSLGAAVAVEIARHRKVRALIMESGFTSANEMAGTLLFLRPLSRLFPKHYNNVGKMSQIQVPTLIIHGDADDLIPFSMGRTLYDAASRPKYFYSIKGAGHNDTYLKGGKHYFETVAQFAREGRLKNDSG